MHMECYYCGGMVRVQDGRQVKNENGYYDMIETYKCQYCGKTGVLDTTGVRTEKTGCLQAGEHPDKEMYQYYNR